MANSELSRVRSPQRLFSGITQALKENTLTFDYSRPADVSNRHARSFEQGPEHCDRRFGLVVGMKKGAWRGHFWVELRPRQATGKAAKLGK